MNVSQVMTICITHNYKVNLKSPPCNIAIYSCEVSERGQFSQVVRLSGGNT